VAPSRTGPLATFALKIGVAATLGPAISGVPGAAVLATAYGTQFPRVWWAWWNAGAIGMVMLLPLMVSISRERVQAALRRPMLLRLIALFVLCMAIGTGAIVAGHEPFVVMSLPLVIVALASNPFATALLTLLSALALEGIAHLGGMQFWPRAPRRCQAR
jgi:integral membrane sensor domain MASE1